MFLLRCAFWLSIVYATMFWHAAPWRVATTPLVTQTIAGASAFCAAHGRRCIEGAVKVQQAMDSIDQLGSRPHAPKPAR